MKIIKKFLVFLLLFAAFFPVVISVESGIIQITTNTASQRTPKIYGDKIVWNDQRNGANNYDIYMYDLSTGQETGIVTESGNQYSPDIYGNKVVYVNQSTPFAPRDVIVLDLSTGQKTMIARVNGTQPNPAISANRVVWQDFRNGNDDIYMYEFSTGNIALIDSDQSFQGWPDVDGDIVVWQDARDDNPKTVGIEYNAWVYDIAANNKRRLSPTAGNISPPRIFGKKIVTSEAWGGQHKIYVYDLTILTQQALPIQINVSSDAYLGDINGERIVYYDRRNNNSDIYMYDLSSKQETRITNNPYNQYFPSIYGDTTVWEDIRTGNDDIFMKKVPAPNASNSTPANNSLAICSDSDGGLKYNVKGTTSLGYDPITDYCESDTILREGYCSSIYYRIITTYECLGGCLNGACLPDPQIIPSTTGWNKTFWVGIASTPVVADIDNDGVLDVIAISWNNSIYAWDYNGNLKPGWPVYKGKGMSLSGETPAIADIDNDGFMEIFVGSADGYLYGLRYDGSAIIGWPKKLNTTINGIVYGMAISASAAVGDIDGDGSLDVAIAGMIPTVADSSMQSNRIYAFDKNGNPLQGFPRTTENGGNFEQSPALADLNKDGKLEIIIGNTKGTVYVLSHDGTDYPGWPVSPKYNGFVNPTNGRTSEQFPSSPSVADIDGDGNYEIAMNIGPFFESGLPSVSTMYPSQIYVWKSDGTVYPGWPKTLGPSVFGNWWYQNIAVPAPLVFADVDGDGKLEIFGGDNGGRIYAWQYNGSLLSGFPILAPTYSMYSNVMNGYIFESQLLIGDIDGDNAPEIIGAARLNSLDYYAKQGELLAYNMDGTIVNGWPKIFNETIQSSTPVIADLDKDNKIDFLMGTRYSISPLYEGRLSTWEEPWNYDINKIPTSKFRFDLRNTGVYKPTASNASLASNNWQYKIVDSFDVATWTSAKAAGNAIYAAYTTGTNNNNYLKLAKSVDGGETFNTSTIVHEPYRVQYMSLSAVNENVLFVSYFSGYPDFAYKIAKSVDGGKSWSIKTIVPMNKSIVGYSSIFALDANNLFMAYDSDYSLGFAKSVDGGLTWSYKIIDTKPDPGFTGRFPSIKAISPDIIYIGYDYQKTCGGWDCALTQERFAKSVDGGENWQISVIDDGGNDPAGFTSIDALGNNIFVAYEGNRGEGMKFAKSTDAGATWSVQYLYNSGAFQSISVNAISPNTILIAGYDSNVNGGGVVFIKSEDSASSWEKQNITYSYNDGYGASMAVLGNKVFVSYGNYQYHNMKIAISTQDIPIIPSTCGNGICDEPFEYYGNCIRDCPSVCGNGICESDENNLSCYNDCQLIRFNKEVASILQSIRLPNENCFTNLSELRDSIANTYDLGNNYAITIEKLKQYSKLAAQFNEDALSDDEWVLRSWDITYNGSYRKSKAGNKRHYLEFKLDFSNLSLKSCIQTSSYFDGSAARIRSKSLTGKDTTCPLCGDDVCESAETISNCPKDCTTSKTLQYCNITPYSQISQGWKVTVVNDKSTFNKYYTSLQHSSIKLIGNTTYIAYATGNPGSNVMVKFAKSEGGTETFNTSIITNSIYGPYYPSLFALNENTLFVSYDYQLHSNGSSYYDYRVAKSIDRGKTWSITTASATDGEASSRSSIFALDGQHLFMSYDYYPAGTSDSLGFAKSADGGKTWTNKLIESYPAGKGYIGRYNSIIATDPNTIYILYDHAYTPSTTEWYGEIRLAKSTDGGNTWTIIIVDKDEQGRNLHGSDGSVSLYAAGNNIYAAYQGDNSKGLRFAKSVDWGSTWNKKEIYVIGYFDPLGMKVIDDKKILIASHGTLDKTSDGGQNWQSQTVPMGPYGGYGNSMDALGNKVVIAFWDYSDDRFKVAINENPIFTDNAPPMTNYTNSSGGPPRLKWSVSINDTSIWHAPIVADLDNDGHKEIVAVLTADMHESVTPQSWKRTSKIYLFDSNGAVAQGWPIDPFPNSNHSITAMAVGDINDDGKLDIVVADAEQLYYPKFENVFGVNLFPLRIYAYDYQGKLLNGFPILAMSNSTSSGAYMSLYDIDRDGSKEIILYHVNSSPKDYVRYGRVSAYKGNGQAVNGFPINFGEIFEVSPIVVGDVDNDGIAEIGFGSGFGSSVGMGFNLIKANSSTMPGWPVKTDRITAPTFTEFGPSIGDINNDGTNEIISGSWGSDQSGLYAFQKNGSVMVYVNKTTSNGSIYVPADATLADLDADSSLEIIMPVSRGAICLNPPACTNFKVVKGILDAWHPNGTVVKGFPVEYEGFYAGRNANFGSVMVGDIDGDGKPDILLITYTFPTFPSGYDTYDTYYYNYSVYLNAWHGDGSVVPGYPVFLPIDKVGFRGFPLSIDDIDNDGTIDLITAGIQGGTNVSSNRLDTTNFITYISNIEIPSTYNPETMHWPMFRHDAQRTGQYKKPLKKNECAELTIKLNSLPNVISNDTLVSADVCSPNGLKECSVCISLDNNCDTEWTSNNVSKNFGLNDPLGTCSYTWSVAGYNDANYLVNLRVSDAQNRIKDGIAKFTFLDKTPPVFNYINVPSVVKSSTMIKFAINATDNYNVSKVSVSVGNQTMIAKKNNLTGLHEGEITAPFAFGTYAMNFAASDFIGNTAYKSVAIRVEEPINWSNDAELTFDGYSSVSPNLAIDSNKNKHIAWEDLRDGNSEIYYSKLDSKGSILIQNKRITNNIYNSKNPSIAADNTNNAAGNVHVVWNDDRDGNKEIYYSRLGNNGAAIIDNKRLTANLFSSQMPKIFVDESNGNNINLLWLDNRDGNFNLYYKKFDYNLNVLVNDKKITSDNLIRFDSSSKTNITAITYQNSKNEVFYLRIDNNGDVLANKKILDFGLNPAVALSNSAYIASVNSQNDLEYAKFDFNGNPILAFTKITYLGSASNPSITTDIDNNIHMTWEDSRNLKKEIYYTKLDSNGNIIISQSAITNNATSASSPKIAIGSVNILYYDTDKGIQEIFLKTSSFDTTAPLISSVGSNDLREFSALINWQTDEPSTSTVNYGINSLDLGASDNTLTRQHSILLNNLNPSSQYLFEVDSSDIFSNKKSNDNNGFHYTFKTKSTQNRPALPTTFYGLVNYNNASPAGDILVTATWTDTNNLTHTTSVKTLNFNEAFALNDTSLVGYFLFNLGNVKASDGSVITVSAPNDITNPHPYLYASPGASSIRVQQPIIIDMSPPAITINSPKEITYSSPYLNLNYDTNEEISWAGFKLNEEDTVAITSMRKKNINITARIGENTITVSARDLVGFESSNTIKFFVQDTVPPKVFVDNPIRVNKVAVLSANVSDSTNSLKPSCQICISNDGICDTEWIDAINQFSPGDSIGKCTYTWDTYSKLMGTVAVNFRINDVADNQGTGTQILVDVDNNPPPKVTGLYVNSVTWENSLNLTWDSSVSPDFSYYNVYRSSAPFADVSSLSAIAKSTKNNYKETNLISRQTYYYAVAAVDNLGNENKIVSSTSGTVADTIKPIVAINSPSASAVYNKKTIDLIYDVNEQVNYCVYSLNKAGNISLSSSITITAAEGSNTLDVYCEDLGRNIGKASVSFNVDSIAPNKITDLKVSTLIKENVLLLQWSAIQNDTLLNYNIYRSNAPFTDATGLATIATTTLNSYKDINLITQGNYYYAVTAVDLAFNENKQVLSVKGVVADTIAPIVLISSPINNLYRTKSVDLNYTVNEKAEFCWYKLNNANNIFISGNAKVSPIEGMNLIILSCNDTGTNIGSAQVNFEADNEMPAQISGLSVNTVNKENSLQLNWLPSSASDFSKYNVYRSQSKFGNVTSITPIISLTSNSYKDTNLVSQSTYYYSITSVDNYNNENKSVVSVNGTVADVIPPKYVSAVTVATIKNETSLIVSWNQNNDSDFLQYNIYRASSPLVLIKSILNKSVTSFKDANLTGGKTYSYSVTSVDKSGNENTSASLISATSVDLVPPIITVTSPQNQKYNTKDIIVTYSTNEQTSLCMFSLNNKPNITTAPTINADEGANTIKIYCNDTWGNIGASNQIPFSVDTIAPNKIKGLNAGAIPGQNSLNITWQPANASDFLQYKLYRSTASFTDVSLMAPLTTSMANKFTDNFLVSELTYFYAVTAQDDAGNENKSVIAANATVADTIAPPQVTGLNVNPTPGENSLSLTWDKSLASDFFHYNVYRSVNSFSDITSMNPVKTLSVENFKDNGLTSGANYYYAVAAVDYSGNYNKNVISVSGTVADTIAPNVTLISPTNIKYNTKTVSLQYQASESTAWCAYSLNNGANLTAAQTILSNEGSNTIILYCSDSAGNIGNSPVISFFVDTTAPSNVAGLIIKPIPKQPSLNLTWNANTESDFNFYRIYRSLSSFNDVSNLVPISQIKNTFYIDASLKSETAYYYAVTSVDNLNNENKNIQSTSITTADLNPPIITIISPSSQTYNTKDLNASYLANEAVSWCAYSLNNALNISISGSIPIKGNEGLNNLKIYCSDVYDNIGFGEVNFNIDVKAPDSILGLSVMQVRGENSLLLNWNPSTATDFSKYNVYRSQSTFSDVSSLTPVSSTAMTSYKDVNLASGQIYYYAITAVDNYNNENKSVMAAIGTVADTIPPDQISGLEVKRVSGQIALNISWSASEAADFAYYNVYRSASYFTDVSSMVLLKSNLNETNYPDANTLDGTTYFYAVTAVDKSGNENKNVISKSGTTLDITSPQIFVSKAGNRVAGIVVLSATVIDTGIGLKKSCEICLTNDGICDTEWNSLNVMNNFNDGDKNGTCSYSWDTSSYPVTSYLYNFKITDADDNIGVGLQQQTEVISATGKFQFSIPLSKGWNLISLPLIPQDQSIESVLSPIAGSYSKLYYYDASAASWQVFNPNRGVFDQPNNLLQLTSGKGYWIEMLAQGTLTISGFEASNYQSDLSVGWNYIGYPYYGSKNISLALASLGDNYNKIYSYNAEMGKWDVYNRYPNSLEPNTLTQMAAGIGYLIDIRQATVWKP